MIWGSSQLRPGRSGSSRSVSDGSATPTPVQERVFGKPRWHKPHCEQWEAPKAIDERRSPAKVAGPRKDVL